MGICASVDSTAVDYCCSTAKVILPDGRLQEFSGPVSASEVLLRHHPSSFFLCCADDVDLDGYLSAVPSSEALDPGQIYFVLPSSMLRRHLHPDEMAKLALRASSTLTVGTHPYVSCKTKTSSPSADVKRERRSSSSSRRRPSGRPRKFDPELTAIPE